MKTNIPDINITYHKIKKVIHSCETEEHFKYAKKYIALFSDQYENVNWYNVYYQLILNTYKRTYNFNLRYNNNGTSNI